MEGRESVTRPHEWVVLFEEKSAQNFRLWRGSNSPAGKVQEASPARSTYVPSAMCAIEVFFWFGVLPVLLKMADPCNPRKKFLFLLSSLSDFLRVFKACRSNVLL